MKHIPFFFLFISFSLLACQPEESGFFPYNGRFPEWEKIDLYVQKPIGLIQMPNDVSWYITSGRKCDFCDQNRGIYILKSEKGIIQQNKELLSFSFPGKHYYWETGEMTHQSRVFVGNCKDSAVSVLVWIQSSKIDSIWVPSIYQLTFTSDTKIGEQLDYSTALEKQIISSTKSGGCIEISPINQTSEP